MNNGQREAMVREVNQLQVELKRGPEIKREAEIRARIADLTAQIVALNRATTT